MKKIAMLLCAAALISLSFVLAGCSAGKNNTTDNSISDTASDEQPSDTDAQHVAKEVDDGASELIALAAPDITSVSSLQQGSMTVDWSVTTDAAGYQVSYSSDSQFIYSFTSQIESPNKTSIDISSRLVLGRTYYIKVRAYGEDNNGRVIYSQWSEVSAFELKPQTIEITSLSSPNSGQVLVDFSTEEAVSGYQLEYSADDGFNDAFTADIDSSEEESFLIGEGLVVGTTYYFRARAYAADGEGGNVYSDWSAVSAFELAPEETDIVSVSSPETGKISVKWRKVENVAGYQVEYCSNSQFDGASVADFSSQDTDSASITSGLVVGTTYYIRVRTYGKDKSGNNVYSQWSDVSAAQLTPPTIKLTTVSTSSAGDIKVSWSKDEKVSGYQVNYSTASDFSNSKSVDIASSSTVSVKLNDGISFGNTYYIRLRAYGKDADGNKVYGSWGNTAAYALASKAPDISEVSSPRSGSINVQWDKISGASGYQVCYSSKSDYSDSYTVDVSSSSTTNTTFSKGLIVGTTYYITVRAYTKKDGVTMYGSWCKTNKYQLMPQTPTISSVSSPWTKYILVKWKEDIGAAGFQISYSSDPGFSGAKTINADSSSDANIIINDGLEIGKTYYVRIRSYGKDASGTNVYSDWSAARSIKCEVVNGIETVDLVSAVNGSVIKDTPAWSGKTLASFKKGAVLNKIGTSGNWVMVEYNGTIGYVYNKTFKNSANYTTINTSTLPTVADDWLFDNGTDIKTIYNYAWHMYYSASAKEDTIENMCVQVFKTKTGACYHHAAILKYLLERAGYEVYYIKGKSFVTSDHAWVLVKTSDGWRHYDATPFNNKDSMYHSTDAQASDYLSWDRSKFPAAV